MISKKKDGDYISSYIIRKYKDFIYKYGYIPEMFNPYNTTEIKDYSPTITARCGDTGTSATVLIIETEGKQEKIRIKNKGGC